MNNYGRKHKKHRNKKFWTEHKKHDFCDRSHFVNAKSVTEHSTSDVTEPDYRKIGLNHSEAVHNLKMQKYCAPTTYVSSGISIVSGLGL